MRMTSLWAAAGLAVLATITHAGDSRVVLCHVPADEPDSFRTIVVSTEALESHLDHGDLIGACEIPAEERCDDGNPCTVDAFVPGTVRCDPMPAPVVCDDGILCTDDACDPERGCVSTVTCAPDAPVCDPAATDPEDACTGSPGDCPLDLIAAVNGWDLRPVERVDCTGFAGAAILAVETRGTAAKGLCGQGTQDISCCQEVCDCRCGRLHRRAQRKSADGAAAELSLAAADNGADARADWTFATPSGPLEAVAACVDAYTSPAAVGACVEGICTGVTSVPAP